MPKKYELNFNSLEVGQSVCVTYVAPDAETVVINFVGGHDDIVFHTSIRYSGSDLVLNTKPHGAAWGAQEKPAGFLFAHGQTISMCYEVTADGFNVSYNGNYLAQYKHRMPVSSIKGVHVKLDTDNATCKAKLQSIDIKY